MNTQNILEANEIRVYLSPSLKMSAWGLTVGSVPEMVIDQWEKKQVVSCHENLALLRVYWRLDISDRNPNVYFLLWRTTFKWIAKIILIPISIDLMKITVTICYFGNLIIIIWTTQKALSMTNCLYTGLD